MTVTESEGFKIEAALNTEAALNPGAALDTGAAEWCRESPQGTVLLLHITPGAKHTQVAGLHGTRLKVTLAQRAVDGRANRALVEFLAAECRVKKSSVVIVSGELSREKMVRIDGLAPAAVRRALNV